MLTEVFPAWSGTMTAYKIPGEDLGRKVEYGDPETGYRRGFLFHRNTEIRECYFSSRTS